LMILAKASQIAYAKTISNFSSSLIFLNNSWGVESLLFFSFHINN